MGIFMKRIDFKYTRYYSILRGASPKTKMINFKLVLNWFYSTYSFKLCIKYKNNMKFGYFQKAQNISFSWMWKTQINIRILRDF